MSASTLGLNKQTRIGWVGTGVMGQAMCGHILASGYPVTVYSRSQVKTQALQARGAVWAETPQALAACTEVVFTMVGLPRDVRDVYLGDNGILSAQPSPSVVVDMTTSEPSLAVEIAGIAAQKGIQAIDAPVSGGDVGARNATLSIMLGGAQCSVEALMPLFKVMGKTLLYQGSAGSGQHTKMANQIVVAGTMIGVCESLLYAYQSGLSLELMLQSISGGAAACWALDHLAPRLLQRDFNPGFLVDHFVKDMGIALDEAKRRHLVLPGLALVHQLYVAVQAQGHGQSGTQALLIALEQLSQTELRSPS